MAGNQCKSLKIDRNGWKWLEMTENCGQLLKMAVRAGISWKWPEMTENCFNGWKRLAMIENDWNGYKWPEMDGTV